MVRLFSIHRVILSIFCAMFINIMAGCSPEGIISCEGEGCRVAGNSDEILNSFDGKQDYEFYDFNSDFQDGFVDFNTEGENGEFDEDSYMDINFEDEQPIPPPHYSFAVFGDNQFATTSCTSGVSERMAIPKAIIDYSPTFILHTGDLMDHGYEDGAYEQFVNCYSEMLGSIAFFPTPGNHDMGSGGILNYRDYLEDQLFNRNPFVYGDSYNTDFQIFYMDDPTDYCDSPSNPCMYDVVPSGFTYKTFYAYSFKNAYFISFEQGTRWWTDTPKTWVENHLSQARGNPDIKFIFVHMHHPMYSTTMAESADGECIQPVRRHYEQLFRDYDVTIVFSGHAHVYDRFYVPDDGHPTRARPAPDYYPFDGQGVHYIVTGGGGGPLPSPCPPGERQEISYDYSQNRGCGYHFTYVEIEGNTITISIVGVEGRASSYTTSVWDTFVIGP